MRNVTCTGKTVELAVESALDLLQVGRDRVEVTVKVAPVKGFLRIGARDAEVHVRVIEDPVGDAERFLREMFIAMKLVVKVTTEVHQGQVTFHLTGERVGVLIGKHGQTLDAIQYLVNAVGNKFAEQHVQIIIDSEGYRERRRQQLIYIAQKTAHKATLLGKEIVMEVMTSQERKVIHVALQGRRDVRTESRGHEPERAIVVIPMEVKRSYQTGPSRRASSHV